MNAFTSRITSATPAPSSSRWLRGCAAAALGVGCVALACADLRAADRDATRQSMRRVFDALADVLPTAVSGSGWSEMKGPAGILATEADALAAHADSKDPSFRFLSTSLASDARQIERQLELRKYESAAFFTERVAETCIACHVRLPRASEHDFADTLLERVDPQTLTPFARASLHSAARRFDQALETYEREFANPRAGREPLEFSDALTSYLIVALRVRRDPVRAQRGLDILGRRPDLSAQLERNLPIWRRALRELEPALSEPLTLERARTILAQGHALTEFPFDSAGRIHGVVASALLFRYLEEKRPAGPALAETLYLLAKTEAFTRRAFDMSEAESYLEQAIEAAPHTTIAERAYVRLEVETILRYRGPEGILMPGGVTLWLEKLRERSRVKPVRARAESGAAPVAPPTGTRS